MTGDLAAGSGAPLYRSVHLLDVLRRFAENEGVSTAELLAGNTLRESDLHDPDFLATAEQEMEMIRCLMHAVRRPGLGLEVGMGYHAGAIGPVGMAMLHSETLGEAVEVALEHRELIGSHFDLSFRVAGGQAVLAIPELADAGDTREFLCERQLTALVRICNDLVGAPVAPDQACVGYRAPAHRERYAEALGCPVRFGDGPHRLVIGAARLDDRLPMANPLARRTYLRHCADALARRRSHGSTAERVTHEIVFRREGIPDLESVADRLHLSSRTLRRRLAAEGTSFRAVVADIRRAEALRLLRDGDTPIDQIAAAVGYGDLPNFYRAFRGWTGTTPGDYRRRLRG